MTYLENSKVKQCIFRNTNLLPFLLSLSFFLPGPLLLVYESCWDNIGWELLEGRNEATLEGTFGGGALSGKSAILTTLSQFSTE